MNMRLGILFSALVLLGHSGLSEEKGVPLPKPQQLTWQNAELAAVFHYDLHVFDGKRYNQNQNHITPIPDYNIFNPTEYNVDQWIRSIKAAGFKIAILTATHETGFALYQSDVNPYCMKALKWRDGKGDVVRDFVDACRRHGILPGVYIGIRWNSFLGIYSFKMPNDHSQVQRNRQNYYNRMCEGMTRELFSRYGKLAMVWDDGGATSPEQGGPDILPIVDRYQKDILFYHNHQRSDIRWGGTETGTVSYPCWGNFPYPHADGGRERRIAANGNRLLRFGDPNGKYYIPAMADTPLRGGRGRHEWFWEPGDENKVYSLGTLMRMYRDSVGRNATLIMGLTPDPRGLLPEGDAKRLAEWGAEIRRLYGTPVKEAKAVGKQCSFQFDKPCSLSHIVIEEDIAKGERVRSYQIEACMDGKWQTIRRGSCIGHKRIEWLPRPLTVTAVRFTVTASVMEPRVSRVALFSKR